MTERSPSSAGKPRWTVSAAVAAALHVAAAGAFFVHFSNAAPPDTMLSTAIAIDMAALPTAPPAPDHDVPTPKQTDAPAQKPQKKPVVKPLPFTPPPKPAMTDVKPEVVLPTQPEQSTQTKASTQPTSDQNTRESAPDFTPDRQVAAPMTGSFSLGDNSPQALWTSQVMGKIQKLKRYPPLARVRNEQDDIPVVITVDRAGKLVSAKLVHSAGFELLDRESLDVVRRASPFPEPPPEVVGEVITLTLIVQFATRTPPAMPGATR